MAFPEAEPQRKSPRRRRRRIVALQPAEIRLRAGSETKTLTRRKMVRFTTFKQAFWLRMEDVAIKPLDSFPDLNGRFVYNAEQLAEPLVSYGILQMAAGEAGRHRQR
jgi:hypothetical protein